MPLRFLDTGMKLGEQSDMYELRVGVGATGLLMLVLSTGVAKVWICAKSGTGEVDCCAKTFEITLRGGGVVNCMQW